MQPITYITIEASQTAWWGHGIVPAQGNIAMEYYENHTPDDALLRAQLADRDRLFLKTKAHVVQAPFSPFLDVCYKHDALFATDAGVGLLSKQGTPLFVMSNFAVSYRTPEVYSMKSLLHILGVETITLNEGAFLEGGEVHYTPHDKLYFGGLSRANESGHRGVMAHADVKDAIFLQTDSFHLDTVLCPVFNKEGETKVVLVCKDAIAPSSWKELENFCIKHDIELVTIQVQDAFGRDGTGRYVVNGQPLPGVLLTNGSFVTEGVREALSRHGIEMLHTPLTETIKTAGAWHCLTLSIPNAELILREDARTQFITAELEKLQEYITETKAHEPNVSKQFAEYDFDTLRGYSINEELIAKLKKLQHIFQEALVCR